MFRGRSRPVPLAHCEVLDRRSPVLASQKHHELLVPLMFSGSPGTVLLCPMRHNLPATCARAQHGPDERSTSRNLLIIANGGSIVRSTFVHTASSCPHGLHVKACERIASVARGTSLCDRRCSSSCTSSRSAFTQSSIGMHEVTNPWVGASRIFARHLEVRAEVCKTSRRGCNTLGVLN